MDDASSNPRGEAAGPHPAPQEAPQGGELAMPRASRFRALVLPIVTAAGLGILGGLGAFTFGYGEGASYLSNDPNACTNCHVMQGHFDSWVKSSHHAVATCNDCHLPHDFVGKWVTKSDNGFFHSLVFTTGEFHEPIQIKPRNARVVQNACLHCHRDFVHNMLPAEPGGDMLQCVSCHGDVGHAEKEIRIGEPPRDPP